MSITASVNGNLKLTDNLSGDTSFLKQLLLSYTGTVSSFAQSFLLGTSATPINIPSTAAQFVYIRNVPATFTSNVTVTWTPNGGNSATIATLAPGASIILSETDTTYGITALSLSASVVNTPIEYILLS